MNKERQAIEKLKFDLHMYHGALFEPQLIILEKLVEITEAINSVDTEKVIDSLNKYIELVVKVKTEQVKLPDVFGEMTDLYIVVINFIKFQRDKIYKLENQEIYEIKGETITISKAQFTKIEKELIEKSNELNKIKDKFNELFKQQILLTLGRMNGKKEFFEKLNELKKLCKAGEENG